MGDGTLTLVAGGIGFLLQALRLYSATHRLGEERLRRFGEWFLLSLPYYALLWSWDERGFLLVFFLTELALWAGAAFYWASYRTLYVTVSEFRKVAQEIEGFLGAKPKEQTVEEETMGGVIPTILAGPVRSWELSSQRLFLFPHNLVFKESGSKWWLPALPKGVWRFLRERGREGDILLFPFATFPESSTAYIAKYHVLIGIEDLDDRLRDTLLASRLVKAKVEEAHTKRREILSELRSRLEPLGWEVRGPVPIEDKGHVDALLVSPAQGVLPLFVLLNPSEEARVRELAKWLPPPALVLNAYEPSPPAPLDRFLRFDTLEELLERLEGAGGGGTSG